MNVLIIIVVYNKLINEISYLADLADYQVLVYDNSPEAQVAPAGIHYFHNPANVGVSAAYNYGIRLAKERGMDAILILDHDTAFSLEILHKYQYLQEQYGMEYIYAPIVKNGNKIYSPYQEGFIRNHVLDLAELDYTPLYSLAGQSLINSGLLIPLAVIDQTGLFNEGIKLDFSDTYFIEQYKQSHQQVVLVDIYLEHGLSGDEGLDKNRELARFQYYCSGGREYRKSTEQKMRVDRFVFFRMAKLIAKYKTLKPIRIVFNAYLGELKK